MPNLPKIIDNKRKTLLEIFSQIAPQHDTLSIATGYWDLLGTQLVIPHLRTYKKIRLLIGRELLIPRHKISQPEPDYPDKDFFADLETLVPTSDLKELITKIKKLIADKVLEVRVYRKTFLHAKCYIFGDYASAEAIGIIGSSNFTKNGFTQNAELNALESDHRIVTFKPQSAKQETGHLFWFDELWNDPTTEQWDGTFTMLLEQSPVGDTLFSPFETYIKTLYELYRDELDEEELDLTLKGSHELFDFQIKNVHALIRRLKKYKVAMLSDSVGLGKTYTAIEVIKQYLTGDEGLRRVEVICPKSIKEQWRKELVTQGVPNLSPVTLQNQGEIESKRELDHIASVALFVIDESHNLKNRAGKRFEQVIEWIKNNPKSHVLLVTATPINNQLDDITNQILLGARGEAKIFKVTSIDKELKQTVQIDFYQAIENLKKKINQDLSRSGTIDYDYIKEIMTPILRAFVVRRTRQGIQKEYGELIIDGQAKKFPDVHPEVKKYGYKTDIVQQLRAIKHKDIDLAKIYLLPTEEIVSHTKDLKHPLDQIDSITNRLELSRLDSFSPIYFVYQVVLLLGFIPYKWRMYQTRFYDKTRHQINQLKLSSEEKKSLFLQISIYGILRTIFLKRMESSVSALQSSLEIYKKKLSIFEKGIELGKILSLKDLSDIEEKIGLGEDIDPDDIVFDEEEELDTVDDKKYNLTALKNDLLREKALISIMEQQLQILQNDDSKLRAFVELLEKLAKDKPAGSKVLVFSYFADTVNYLKEQIPKMSKIVNDENTGFLSSQNRCNAEVFAGRFSPKAKKYELSKGECELNYLFSTDVLSEGQNLQDCGILINYDLHWNPVRMIQRNGRINRIGTDFPAVYIFNISPESQLEEYLRLVQRLEGKINLIRNTIGTDTPVLDEQENPLEFSDAWQDIYSDNLQKRLKALEVAEKEADLLMSEDEFVSDLKVFDNDPVVDSAYKRKIYNIPLGKWAVMPLIKHRGEGRPVVLSLNAFYDKDSLRIGQLFLSMDQDGDSMQAVTNLQALEWLRTSIDCNKREQDNISLNKAQIIQKVQGNVSAYLEEEEVGAPIGQQADILRLMYEQHFEEQEIEKVRIGFQTTNVLDKQKIRRFVRNIMQAKRSNKAYLDMMHELIEVSVNSTSSSVNVTSNIDSIKQVLFYARDNK